MQEKKYPAVFLDRDGVINYDDDYVYKIDDYRFIPDVFAACQLFIKKGYKLIVITNQAGIARGLYTEEDFNHLNQWFLKQFKKNNIKISGVYYCPHHPVYGIGKYRQSCHCRKPQPGMIQQAALEHKLDLSRSILIGDKISDINAGKNAGISTNLLVKTGKPVTDIIRKQADGAYENLFSLAMSITPLL